MARIENLLGRGCPVCGGPLDAPGVCLACQEALVPWVGPEGLALGGYGRIRGLVRAIKYDGDLSALAFAATRLARSVPPGWPVAGVTFVPTFFWRRWGRPFYAPERLARALAAEGGWVYSPVLARVRYTKSQTRVQHRHRLPQVFAPRARALGLWLLVDDVATSGATFRRARAALMRAGASGVKGVFLAVREKKILGL